MERHVSWLLVVLILPFLPARIADAQPLTATEVKRAIDQGVAFLRQDPDAEFNGYRGALPALTALAMLNAGVPANDRDVSRMLDRTRGYEAVADNLATYTISLRVMALAAADPKGVKFRREIRRDVEWLVRNQVRNGRNTGGWTYYAINQQGNTAATADASNSQYALLALHEATLVGVEVPQEVWLRAKKYWDSAQDPRSKGFNYAVPPRRDSRFYSPTGSMTCAGIASHVIISEHLIAENKAIQNGRVNCCVNDDADEAIDGGAEWLGKNFSVRSNPGRRDAQFYYLYALERAGRLSGRRFFGPHDWYRAGAAQLLKQQKRNGSWKAARGGFGESVEQVATSFAVLFLSKGKAPIVFGKLQHGLADDWDRHPKGVHQLTLNLAQQWSTKLNWQTVRIQDASVNDLMEARVLFISGRDDIDLNDKQKDTLKRYIENGGFVLAEASEGDGCGNGNFDAQFRGLMAELFPTSPMELLPVDHPIWTAHYRILNIPDGFELYGVQACCRTSVVYCPRSLSCRWQVDKPSLKELLNDGAASEVSFCSQVGVNVAAYATGRQLRDKLDVPNVEQGNSVLMLNERVLVLPKLSHNGGADEAPNAWRNVLSYAQSTGSGMRIKLDKKMIDANIEQLQDHPFVFMHGRDRFSFSEKQREDIRTWVDRGGFLFADSICSSEAFSNAFRKEMQLIFKENPLKPIPADHPLWSDPRYGTPLQEVTLRVPDQNEIGGFRDTKTHPQMEGIEIDGQLQVLFSPYDLSCAMENTAVSQCHGYTRNDATIMAVKVLIYYLRRGMPGS